MLNIGVLISGGGTNLQAIIDETKSGGINGKVKLVISNKEDAYGLERARLSGIESVYETDEDRIIEILKENNIDLIVLAGYLKIITPKFVDKFRNKIINIHPSLIPSFCGKGYYGEKVHQGVIDYGAKVTGATVHFVDEGADTGAIIMQETVNVEQDDDAKSLAKRVLEVEHRILKESIRLFCENKLSIQGRRVFINE
jgi:phosphoribosylglycinamide formyltransferase-1